MRFKAGSKCPSALQTHLVSGPVWLTQQLHESCGPGPGHEAVRPALTPSAKNGTEFQAVPSTCGCFCRELKVKLGRQCPGLYTGLSLSPVGRACNLVLENPTGISAMYMNSIISIIILSRCSGAHPAASNSHTPFRLSQSGRCICGRGYSGQGCSGSTSYTAVRSVTDELL